LQETYIAVGSGLKTAEWHPPTEPPPTPPKEKEPPERRHAPWIVDVMKRYPHERYIEPFGGSGAVMFAKEPSKCDVYNDIYSDLVTFYIL